MEKLGIAIIGAGAIADVHIKAYLRYPEICEIRAVCDIFEEKAAKLITDNGLEAAKAFKDFRQAISDMKIDAVSICLPPTAHAEVAISCLDLGTHVVCEKPMAPSLEECDAMIEASKRNGKLLCSVAQNRFKTPNMKIKTMVSEGDIGKILFSTVNSLWWRGGNYYDIWWRGTWEKESGGCMLSHAVHHIDLMLWILGKPASLTATINNLCHFNSEVEDVGTAMLTYPDNSMAQLNASLVHHNELQSLSFQGEKGVLESPFDTWASKALPNGFPEQDVEQTEKLRKRYDELPELETEGHPALIGNFLNSILGKEELLTDGIQGRNTIEVITAIYKAAQTGCRVHLPITADDPFYPKGAFAALMPHFYEKTKSVDNFTQTKPITLGRDIGR